MWPVKRGGWKSQRTLVLLIVPPLLLLSYWASFKLSLSHIFFLIIKVNTHTFYFVIIKLINTISTYA